MPHPEELAPGPDPVLSPPQEVGDPRAAGLWAKGPTGRTYLC